MGTSCPVQDPEALRCASLSLYFPVLKRGFEIGNEQKRLGKEPKATPRP